jgi:transcriptional regulator with XRE-family HTH domain
MIRQRKLPANKMRRPFRELYIGQWIRALGMRPIDVVKGIGINEGYLSELINGKKKNPSGGTLIQIAEFLDIPMNYLYNPPPPQEIINQTSGIDSSVLERLRGRKAS